ncbi:hypothetical protein I4U23_015447 [Adineta vaga]|nr:hypothetical protein I4U23_015447 [Adineta vaga]
MNSSTYQLPNILIDCSIITFSAITICISLAILQLILSELIERKNFPHRVASLLTANVYLSLFFFSVLALEQFVRAYLGHRYLIVSLSDGIYCQFRCYLQWVSICGIMYSNTLQGIYRLCRIVFHTKQVLQSFHFYMKMIVIQWILCFTILIPSFFLDGYKYSVENYYCENDYRNIQSTFFNGAFSYSIPLEVTTTCYVYTWMKMHRRDNNLLQTMSRIREMSARRDLIVLFRICIIHGLLLVFFTPSVILLFIYIGTGYVPWWSSQVQWLVLSFSIACVSVLLLFVSPYVRELWIKRFHRQHRHDQTTVQIIMRVM